VNKIEDIIEQSSKYSFYGVWGNYFKLGNIIFYAIENPDDGLRSYLESVIMCVDGTPITEPDYDYKEIVKEFKFKDIVRKFSKKPIALVNVFADKDDVIISDFETGHIFLKIGTDVTEDHYPCFYFNFNPMPSKKK